MKLLFALCFCLFTAANLAGQQPFGGASPTAITNQYILEIADKDFPDINKNKLRVKTLKSDTSFFQARYSILRYATFRPMRHLVYVNPRAFELGITENALRAVLAHELAHVDYYTRKNRLQLLGLIRLANPDARIGFERKADLEAIVRGYGRGLIEYREWLYRNIPEASVLNKRKVYFSPDEIRLIIKSVESKPLLIKKWRKSVPENLEEIQSDVVDE